MGGVYRLIETIGFSHPWLLTLALLPVALVLWNWLRSSKRSAPLPFSSFAWLPKPTGHPARLRAIAPLVRLLAGLGLVPIVAGISSDSPEPAYHRPQSGWVILLDISSSMTAEDFQPQNRLVVAKESLENFIVRNRDLALGLIVFAATPRLVLPLTPDHQALLDSLGKVVAAGFGEDGTAIGSGIASAVNRLRGENWTERRILLITDGVSNRGVVSPLDAARLARVQGVRIDTVGIGTDSVARYWVPSPEGRPVQMRARLEIDDESLLALARESGGTYQRVRNSHELENALLALKTGEHAPRRVVSLEEKYDWTRALAWLVIFCLALDFVWSHLLFSELVG